MKSVSRFESNLLKILYSVLGKAPLASTLPLINRAYPGKPPKCLSRDTIELVKQALYKGCITTLTHWGSWKTELFLRKEEVKQGRLWERSHPADLGLTFSPITMDLLIWLTSVNPTGVRVKWKPPKRLAATVGDQFFMFLLIQVIGHTEPGKRLIKHPLFSENGLIRLAFPDLYAEANAPEPNFQPWVNGVGATILESMQTHLAGRWQEIESSKTTISKHQAMQELGLSQTTVLASFIHSANEANRTDLYRFLLQLLARILTEDSHARDWSEHLDLRGVRLAEREAIYQNALAILHVAEMLNQQNQYFASVTYIDQDYAASQLWKSNWEQYQGDRLIALSQKVLRDVTF